MRRRVTAGFGFALLLPAPAMALAPDQEAASAQPVAEPADVHADVGGQAGMRVGARLNPRLNPGARSVAVRLNPPAGHVRGPTRRPGLWLHVFEARPDR